MEPLGYSQVFSYLKVLSLDRPIHLISFEKPDDWRNVRERKKLEFEISKTGIIWHPLRYHKKPTAIATTWDIVNGIRMGLWLVFKHRLNILHARSYVPSLMALVIKRLTGASFLFDMRGFWADEKLESGWSSDCTFYKVFKRLERKFLLKADYVVSLTHAAVSIMKNFSYLQNRMPPIIVIPTCADLTRFKPNHINNRGSELTIGYVGSVRNWYLFEKTAACFAILLRKLPLTKLLIVNRNEHAYIREVLALNGVPLDSVELISATPDEMPKLMNRMDANIFFIKPVFSKQASSATKLGELLGCGVPCMSNTGVGDMASILEDSQVGIALEDFDESSIVTGLDRLLVLLEDPAISSRCVAVANKYFSLCHGVEKYRYIYKQLDKSNNSSHNSRFFSYSS
ncbi:glycosyl transferases group 1 family protein [Synechococcus sp. A15-127]|nr:glycosyl transferases group 1 family protein [Synechococcus sp. A15-127]